MDIREFGVTFFPSPEELLPFYEQAIATGDADLLAEVDRICAEHFSCDAEDLPALCEF
jgi:hypothetical protein